MKKQLAVTGIIILFIVMVATIVIKLKDDEMPEAKHLSEFPHTTFITTLEHNIADDKNHVYCATLLFAWDGIKQKLQLPLTIADASVDLKQLNQSTSFKDVLQPHEYSVSSSVNGQLISSKAEFDKTLPFEFSLQSFKNRLLFNGESVASFGLDGYESHELISTIEIVYYKNDDNFIVKLLPQDNEHEIVLFKTEQTFDSMAKKHAEINRLIDVGNTEKQDPQTAWKYTYIYNTDSIIIPKFNFNIETNYPTLQVIFSDSQQEFFIEKAWQRTAFILDESGAIIESEAEIEVSTKADIEDPDAPIIKPKNMIFDTDFLVLLKRKNAENPYFGLWVANTELMIKE